MALAAVALSATTASADTPVEVHDETGTHCDPCEIHLTSESRIESSSSPVIITSRCEDEWEFQIEEVAPGQEELDTVSCLDSRTNPDAAGSISISGEWTVEGSPIEIEHL
jgi:hypothetical protein